MQNGKKVAVVIAAHRSYATIELCLRGFSEIVIDPSDLVFVDNGSGGVISNQVAHAIPGATLITLRENRLFCGGYNAGIRWAIEHNYDFVLLVNADVEVINPTFVDVLIDAMESNARSAFVGPLVYYRDRRVIQTTSLQFPNLLRHIFVWLPFTFFPQLVAWQSNKEHEAEFLNGVCVLCRVEAIRQIGLLDESYQAYVEDADWAWRARAKGWQSRFVPVPSIIHHEEQYGYEHFAFKTFLLKRNTVYWFLRAGKPRSARLYAITSLMLARLRTLFCRHLSERQEYIRFALDLEIAYRKLFSDSNSVPFHEAQTTKDPTPVTGSTIRSEVE